MAQQVVTQLIDDLDGGEAEETIEFVWGGIQYRIDLSEKNADKFRKAMAPYVTGGQRVGGKAKRGGKAAGSRTGSDAAVVRAWAQANGFEVPERGRIPNEVREAYETAQHA